MSSHRERVKATLTPATATKKHASSVPTYYENRHSNTHNGRSMNRRSEYSLPDEEDGESGEPRSPEYANLPHENKRPKVKSTERLPEHYTLSKQSLPLTKVTTGTYNSKPYLPTYGSHTELVYKSQSLHALKTKEPNKVLLKSSIQQEYHDKMVQKHLKGLTYGRARRPCQIATAMIVLFVLFFTVGLTLICLTYIYKNITFSLDKGEAIGPVILALSFIFLGIGLKYLYDAYRISSMEKNTIKYESYDHRYVGLKNKNYTKKANEKLVSGSATQDALSRVPCKVHTTPRIHGAMSSTLPQSKSNSRINNHHNGLTINSEI